MPPFLSKAAQAGIITALISAIGGFIAYSILAESLGEDVTLALIFICTLMIFLYFYYEFIKEDFDPKITNLLTERRTLLLKIEKISKQIQEEVKRTNSHRRQILNLNDKIDILNLESRQHSSKTKEEVDTLLSRFSSAQKEKSEKEGELQALEIERDFTENKLKILDKKIDILIQEVNVYKKSLIEKSSGFPTLLKVIEQYDATKDREIEDLLRFKKHPSPKAADVVREQSLQRRRAQFEFRRTNLLIEYYEKLAPFLIEYKDDIVLPENEDILSDYSEEEKLDPTINYLTKEEYRKLPSAERNQRALDRYWKRPKSKWHIGKIYERYVGYLYEDQGYDVEYSGIIKRIEDLGRDLIAKKGNEIIVIQCKNWASFKKIYENSIFQFFGTVFQFKDQNKDKKVKAVFYSTTELSVLARRFAKELGIELREGFKMGNNYPCIKCNISRKDGAKIYHLPFDQQYDKAIIEKTKGEFFCKTVKEAEEKGFRRAFRYRGMSKK